MILSLKSELPASVKGAPELFSVSDSPQDSRSFVHGCPTLSGCHRSVIDLLSHNLLWDAIVLWTGRDRRS